MGSLDKTSKNVGTGLVGAPACGDVMKLQVQLLFIWPGDGNLLATVLLVHRALACAISFDLHLDSCEAGGGGLYMMGAESVRVLLLVHSAEPFRYSQLITLCLLLTESA